MATTTADLLVQRLIDWGVDTIFGLPGDGINGIMEALRKRQDEIRFIHVRHEEAAAFMACGYAKFTGRLGVCLATSGPGGIHLLNGLYDAKLDRQPVLAITGMAYHDLIHTFTQQDVELDKLFMDVAVYNQRVMGKAHVENSVRPGHAAPRWPTEGVAHITFPADVQEHEERTSARSATCRTTLRMLRRAARPSRTNAGCAQAADILNAGKKVAILAGQGALDATDQLEQIADLLAAPIVKPLLGKGCGARRQPVHHGRHRSARARARRRKRWKTATRCSWSARRFPTSSSSRSPGRRARSRSTSIRCASASLPGRRGAGWRQPAHARGTAADAAASTERDFLEQAQKSMARVVAADGRARHAARDADETAGRRARAEPCLARRRDHHLRQRHDRHVGGAAYSIAARPALFAQRQPGVDGQRLPLCHRGAARLSGAASAWHSSATAAFRCSWPNCRRV